jgi:hypothetical protein
MTASDERTGDSLIEDAIEILIERTLDRVAKPDHANRWTEQARSKLHERHDRRAYALMAEDRALTARQLADLLAAAPSSSAPPPALLDVHSMYAEAENRRRRRNADAPTGWLPPDKHVACLAAARAALTAKEPTS